MNTIKLAIAEDHGELRKALVEGLSVNDKIQIVIEAENGAILLDKLINNPTDVVILDIRMPIMDGFETLPEIKTKHPDVKVLMYSSMVVAPVIDKCKNLGANGFVSKDSSIKTLMDAVLEVNEKGYSYNEHFKNDEL